MQRRELIAALATSTSGSLVLAGTVGAATAATGVPARSTATTAEQAAGLTPTDAAYPEGDIRRYGASVAAADNSRAVNAAMSVSANGGNAAFVPPGTWRLARTVDCPLSSSLYGMGQGSVLAPQGCDGLTFSRQPNYAGARFIKDLSLVGTDCADKAGISVEIPAASGGRVTGVLFSNLNIQNFGKGAYLRGLWNSVFRDCFLFNNSIGYHLHGQNVQVRIDGGFIQLNPRAPYEKTYGVLIDSMGGESTQSTHLNAVGVYGFNVNIALVLALYTSIQNCDISMSRSIGVQIVTVQGGTVVRDCWIQTNNSGPTTAVQIAPRGGAAVDKIIIEGCTLVCDVASNDSTGISVGPNQLAVVTNGNTVGRPTAPFAVGIDNGGARNHIAKFNTIFASATAVRVGSAAASSEIGPNTVQSGTALEYRGPKPTRFNYLE